MSQKRGQPTLVWQDRCLRHPTGQLSNRLRILSVTLVILPPGSGRSLSESRCGHFPLDEVTRDFDS